MQKVNFCKGGKVFLIAKLRCDSLLYFQTNLTRNELLFPTSGKRNMKMSIGGSRGLRVLKPPLSFIRNIF